MKLVIAVIVITLFVIVAAFRQHGFIAALIAWGLMSFPCALLIARELHGDD